MREDIVSGVTALEKMLARPGQDKDGKFKSQAETYVSTFMQTFDVRPGRVMKIKAGSRYSITKPGSLVFVASVMIDPEALINKDDRPLAACFALNEKGHISVDEAVEISVQDLETLPKKEEMRIIKSWDEPPKEFEPITDGDPVELTEDVTMVLRGFGTRAIRLPKGLKGIVDVPDMTQGGDVNDCNSAKFKRPVKELKIGWMISLGECTYCHRTRPLKGNVDSFQCEIPLAGHGFQYQLYIPRFKTHINVDRSQIKKRAFDREMFDHVIMQESTRRMILAAVMGKENDLCRWGIDDEISKGKGTIILAYGPPGTGKTMTAEALAERLERPLYIVDSSELKSDPNSFEESLKEIIERAKRWKAVVLMDEAEIYLQERGDDGDQNARVASMLRHLEQFEGILFLTTNRPVKLDFAIDSRIHAKIFYPAFDADLRDQVWRVTMPTKMKVEGFEEAMKELRLIPINGREIKTAIINAARSASYAGKAEVPAQFLVDAAKNVFDASRQLRAARQHDWALDEKMATAEVTVPGSNGNGNHGHVVPFSSLPTTVQE